MDLEGEIAHALAEWHEPDKPDEWIVDMYREAAAALSPLLNRVRAEALREAHADLQAYTDAGAPFGHRPIEEFLLHRADRIEQNSEGNET